MTMTSLSGCGVRIGESYKAVEVKVDIKNEALYCFDQLTKNTVNYFKESHLAQKQLENTIRVRALSECVSLYMKLFKDFVRGENEDFYRDEELHRFLQESVLPDKNIPISFITELLRLKKALVGGTHSTLTTTELDSMASKFDEIEFYISSSEEGPSSARVPRIFRFIFDNIQEDYSISDFAELIKKTSTAQGTEDEESEKLFSLVQALYAFTYEKHSHAKLPSAEWKYIGEIAEQLLDSYGYFHQATQIHDNYRDNAEYYLLSMEHLLSFLRKVINHHSNSSISKEKLHTFVQSLYELGYFSKVIQLDNILLLVDYIFGQVITRTPAGSTYQIDIEDIDYIRKELILFEKIKNEILDPLSKGRRIDKHKFLATYFSNNQTSQEFENTARAIVTLDPLYQKKESGSGLYIDYKANLDKFNYKSSSIYFLYSSMFRLLQRSLTKNQSNLGGIDYNQFAEFYQIVSLIIKDISTTERIERSSVTSKHFARLEFLITNTLPLSARGPHEGQYDESRPLPIIDMKEAIEGITLSHFILEKRIEFNKSIVSLCDKNSGEQMYKACLREQVLNIVYEHLDQTPVLKSFLETASQNEKQIYDTQIFNLLQIKDGQVFDIIILGLLMQEVIFVRFDEDQDYILSAYEIKQAEPLFKDMIFYALNTFLLEESKSNPSEKEQFLRDNFCSESYIFNYIVTHHKLPPADGAHAAQTCAMFNFTQLFNDGPSVTRADVLNIVYNLLSRFK